MSANLANAKPRSPVCCTEWRGLRASPTACRTSNLCKSSLPQRQQQIVLGRHSMRLIEKANIAAFSVAFGYGFHRRNGAGFGSF